MPASTARLEVSMSAREKTPLSMPSFAHMYTPSATPSPNRPLLRGWQDFNQVSLGSGLGLGFQLRAYCRARTAGLAYMCTPWASPSVTGRCCEDGNCDGQSLLLP